MPESQASFTSNVDSSGNWSAEILDQLLPGLHTLHVSDDYGNEDSALLFITESGDAHISNQVNVIDIPQQPQGFYGFGWVWLVAIGGIFLLNAYAARKITIGERGTHKIVIQLSTWVSFVSVLLFVGFLSAGLYRGFESGDIQDVVLPTEEAEVVELVSISGTLQDPIDFEPVDGVDLSSGDVSIRTNEGGQFVFSQIELRDGVRMTHPMLHKSIVFRPEESGRMDAYFDVGLYNKLIAITFAEAQGRYDEVARYLDRDVDLEDFEGAFESIFDGANITDQELVVVKMYKLEDFDSVFNDKSYKNVIVLVVANRESLVERKFVFDGEDWRFVM